MNPPVSSRFASSAPALLLVACVSVGLPVEVAAQGGEPFADGATYHAPAVTSPANVYRPKPSKAGRIGLALGGAALALVGVGLAGYGTLAVVLSGLPYDAESSKKLRTCCIEHALLAPGFLAMAGGGLMLGYGADGARRGDGEARDAEAMAVDSRSVLIIGGVLLGTGAALYITSAVLTAAMFSQVVQSPYGQYSLTPTGQQLPSASLGTLIPGMLLALPGGLVTGVYLNRYLQERRTPGRTAAAALKPVDVLLAPTLSREVYGLQVSGRF